MIKFLRFTFIGLLFLELITHSYINLDIGKFFIDYKSIIIILLIISLSVEKMFFQ